MRIFIGYGYNERDRWVERYVRPLVEAFGCEVVHGKAVYGGGLAAEVIRSIRECDAMIGFTTRRGDLGGGRFSTHPWVVSELNIAFGQDPSLPFVEVREEGVVASGGAYEAADYQRILYDEMDRAACLVGIAEALKRFHELTRVVRIRLGPQSVTAEIYPMVGDPSFMCSYQTFGRSRESASRIIPVIPVKGNLEVHLLDVAESDLVRISVSARGRMWRSDYDSVDTVDVRLKE